MGAKVRRNVAYAQAARRVGKARRAPPHAEAPGAVLRVEPLVLAEDLPRRVSGNEIQREEDVARGLRVVGKQALQLAEGGERFLGAAEQAQRAPEVVERARVLRIGAARLAEA